MDRFVTLSLVMLAASQVFAADTTNSDYHWVSPWDLEHVCPDACKAPSKHMTDCYTYTGIECSECDEPFPHQLNACYLCAVDSAAAGDTVSGFEDFDAKSAQTSLDHVYDGCQLIDQPIDRVVFGTDVFVASSSAPASLATASSDDVSSAAAANTTSSTSATPASTNSVSASSVPTGNATASAPQPTKSGSARGLSSVTYTAVACVFIGTLATFFL